MSWDTISAKILLDQQLNKRKMTEISQHFPATRSRTATLLRLHPNCQYLNRKNTFKVQPSSKTDFLHVTGGVYKANLHVHRNVLIYDY
jgi:hypothetical protein